MFLDMIYFTSNIKDWNYNKMIKTPNVDRVHRQGRVHWHGRVHRQGRVHPFNPNKKLNDDNYNLYKFNCLIFLEMILKYSKDYRENDVIEWIIKK